MLCALSRFTGPDPCPTRLLDWTCSVNVLPSSSTRNNQLSSQCRMRGTRHPLCCSLGSSGAAQTCGVGWWGSCCASPVRPILELLQVGELQNCTWEDSRNRNCFPRTSAPSLNGAGQLAIRAHAREIHRLESRRIQSKTVRRYSCRYLPR
jgi:hypothetical protein